MWKPDLKAMRSVLECVASQCGIDGTEIKQLDVPGLQADEIDRYCFLLGELKAIEVSTFYDSQRRHCYPIRVTASGMELLDEATKSFWKRAEAAASSAVKHYTGVDVKPFVEFFLESFRKFRAEEFKIK